MSPPTKTDWMPTKRSKIVILRENGLFYAEIARQVVESVTKYGVRMLWLRYGKFKSIKNKTRSGRKKCTSAIDDRKIKRIYLKY